MAVDLIFPTHEKPYIIDSKTPIILRTACYAGVNRSATIREILKQKIHKDSVIFPQYGAYYGNYNYDDIVCISTKQRDGFYEVFETDKSPSIQGLIFSQLGYTPLETMEEQQYLERSHHKSYKTFIQEQYWTEPKLLKSVFILSLTDPDIVSNVFHQLQESNISCDLVVLSLNDTIFKPSDPDIKPQSKEAYLEFIKIVNQYIICKLSISKVYNI